MLKTNNLLFKTDNLLLKRIVIPDIRFRVFLSGFYAGQGFHRLLPLHNVDYTNLQIFVFRLNNYVSSSSVAT
jgi:hypothetical protein